MLSLHRLLYPGEACECPAIRAPRAPLHCQKGNLLLVRKRLSTLSIWLGLFAMLMIHAGPLYSALQLAAAADSYNGHADHSSHEHAPSAHGHHHQASASEPTWLAALEMCGYCELLTLNPPLTLSLSLVLPRHQPEQVQSLPGAPLRPLLRHNGSYARAPPATFHS